MVLLITPQERDLVFFPLFFLPDIPVSLHREHQGSLETPFSTFLMFSTPNGRAFPARAVEPNQLPAALSRSQAGPGECLGCSASLRGCAYSSGILLCSATSGTGYNHPANTLRGGEILNLMRFVVLCWQLGNTGWWKQKAEHGRGGGFKTNPSSLPRAVVLQGFWGEIRQSPGLGLPPFLGFDNTPGKHKYCE